jgi:hypothetical protein
VQESKAAAAMTERIMADVQRSNTEVASLNAYLQVWCIRLASAHVLYLKACMLHVQKGATSNVYGSHEGAPIAKLRHPACAGHAHPKAWNAIQ